MMKSIKIAVVLSSLLLSAASPSIAGEDIFSMVSAGDIFTGNIKVVNHLRSVMERPVGTWQDSLWLQIMGWMFMRFMPAGWP